MDSVQFLVIIAGVIGLFCLVDVLSRVIWPDEDKKVVREWEAIRKTLEVRGGNEHDEFSRTLDDRTGVTSTGGMGAAARRPTRTLRGDITKLWEHCKRTIRTRF